MKILLLLTLFLSSSLHSFSQVWGHSGATWHYDWSGTTHGGYIKITYVGDTVIEGHNCQQLDQVMHSFWWINAQGDMATSSEVLPREHTYYSGDTVFYLAEDHFEILYDFSASIGSKWNILTVPAHPDCNDTSTVKVLQTGTENIAGQNLRYLFIADIDSTNGVGFSDSPLNNSFETPSSKIIERIGGAVASSIFPHWRNCSPTAVDFNRYKLNCYEDNQIFYNPTGELCAYFVGLKEKGNVQFSVAPNPVSNILAVNIQGGNQDYEILTTTGQRLASGKFSLSSNQIDVSVLDRGIYYLKVFDSQGNLGTIRFVKN